MSLNNINNAVRTLITPIISGVTEISYKRKAMPIYNSRNKDPRDEMLLRRCVHYTFDNYEPVLRLIKNDEGKIVCEACNREICIRFTEAEAKQITDIIPILNGLVVLGMHNNLTEIPLKTIIDVKAVLPDIAKICIELGVFIKNEEGNMDTTNNFGDLYQGTAFRNITGF